MDAHSTNVFFLHVAEGVVIHEAIADQHCRDIVTNAFSRAMMLAALSVEDLVEVGDGQLV